MVPGTLLLIQLIRMKKLMLVLSFNNWVHQSSPVIRYNYKAHNEHNLYNTKVWNSIVKFPFSFNFSTNEYFCSLTLWAQRPYIYGQRVIIQFHGDRIYMVEVSTRSLPDIGACNSLPRMPLLTPVHGRDSGSCVIIVSGSHKHFDELFSLLTTEDFINNYYYNGKV